MNKIGIIYFSGTGNTKFVAQTIQEELEKYNQDSDIINIEKDSRIRILELLKNH